MNLSKLQDHGDGQGSLARCSPWGHKESDTAERLNNKLQARQSKWNANFSKDVFFNTVHKMAEHFP